MWEEEEEDDDAAEEEKQLEEGLDENEAEALEGKAAAKKHAEEINPESLTVAAKEAMRRKLEADMAAFLQRGGAIKQVDPDEKKMNARETARAPDDDEEED